MTLTEARAIIEHMDRLDRENTDFNPMDEATWIEYPYSTAQIDEAKSVLANTPKPWKAEIGQGGIYPTETEHFWTREEAEQWGQERVRTIIEIRTKREGSCGDISYRVMANDHL